LLRRAEALKQTGANGPLPLPALKGTEGGEKQERKVETQLPGPE
jgi:hypothetical protein